MRSRPASNDVASLPPALVDGAGRLVWFAHPGYEDTPDFLSLPRVDDGGVCYDTAIVACGLLACNMYDGFLSTDKAGEDVVERPADDVLRDHDRYYYQLRLPPGADPYPLVTSFADWSFPHRNLPGPWANLQLRTNPDLRPTTVTSHRRGVCAVTNCSFSLDVAQCVPYDEQEWWELNGMNAYVDRLALSPLHPQNSYANLLVLRADVGRALNRRHLCFAPKLVEVGNNDNDKEIRLLVHVAIPSLDGQLAGFWHNREVHALPPGVSKECLFARFAYTILDRSVFTFLSETTAERHLCLRDAYTREPYVTLQSAASCRRIAAIARERSPTRRLTPVSPPAAALLPPAPIQQGGQAVAVAQGEATAAVTAAAAGHNDGDGGVDTGSSSSTQQQVDFDGGNNDGDAGSDADAGLLSNSVFGVLIPVSGTTAAEPIDMDLANVLNDDGEDDDGDDGDDSSDEDYVPRGRKRARRGH
ncbi:hypothetical protein MAPG_10797 [Magnaporthiopsis poae ATCC 64411]|uniref:HNH nuclease domain-containing protein n=1 Tax=Magnaporthiopsis poae (strain ATCC 64411 / 73-15) TaxID=644358 RepID=A0A0C4EDJ5_MAGP6|nr:hypothetical protein MAPG_10797 [Magnaporthiopsis poae ATCC 64411]